jgi:hypothetical protein
MARKGIRRAGRLLAMGLVIAAVCAVARALGEARSGSAGSGSARATSGDTWPPVPVNADRGVNHREPTASP